MKTGNYFSNKKIAVFVCNIFIVLSLSLFVSQSANAVCCSYHSLTGCCGKGSCNIFCCDCGGGGCVPNCTFCDPVKWAECAPVVARCAAVCVVSEGDACVTCMGSLYATCEACIAGSSDTIASDKTDSPACGNRDSMYRDIASLDGNANGISLEDFKTYVAKQKELRGKKELTAPIDEIFKEYDADGNGVIDRKEMDAENIKNGFVNEAAEKLPGGKSE